MGKFSDALLSIPSIGFMSLDMLGIFDNYSTFNSLYWVLSVELLM